MSYEILKSLKAHLLTDATLAASVRNRIETEEQSNRADFPCMFLAAESSEHLQGFGVGGWENLRIHVAILTDGEDTEAKQTVSDIEGYLYDFLKTNKTISPTGYDRVVVWCQSRGTPSIETIGGKTVAIVDPTYLAQGFKS